MLGLGWEGLEVETCLAPSLPEETKNQQSRAPAPGTKKRQQIAHGAHVNLTQDRQLRCSLIPLLPGRKQLKCNEVPWPFMQLASDEVVTRCKDRPIRLTEVYQRFSTECDEIVHSG